MTAGDDKLRSGVPRSRMRPLRTRLVVWLSVLAVVAVLMMLAGLLMAWLIVAMPSEP